MIRNRVATSFGIAWRIPSESGGEISGIGIGMALLFLTVGASIYLGGIKTNIFFFLLLVTCLVIDLIALMIGKKKISNIHKSSSKDEMIKEFSLSLLYLFLLYVLGCIAIYSICLLPISPLLNLSYMTRLAYILVNASAAMLPLIILVFSVLVFVIFFFTDKILKASAGRFLMAYYADDKMSLTKAITVICAAIKIVQISIGLATK